MLESVRRRFWYALLLATACILSMTLSYAVVRLTTRGRPAVAPPDQRTFAQANHLRTLSNDLVRLAAELLDRQGERSVMAHQEYREWVVERFTPRVNDIRRKLLGSDAPPALVGALLSATEALASAATQPERRELRNRATEAVLEAATVTEEFIAGLGLRGSLSQPPVPHAF
jgi:hypothetical protein